MTAAVSMERRWLIQRTNQEHVRSLSRSASVSPVIASILLRRGIRTPEDIREFLSPGEGSISDPFDLPLMTEAAARIRAAGAAGETVLVHGDYDADGLTAAAILVSTLRKMGLRVCYFIPHRIRDGYGFNAAGVDAAVKAGASLVITVDCGISSFEAVRMCAERNIDVIISDHHEPLLAEDRAVSGGDRPKTAFDPEFAREGFLVPHAVAVVNPKLQNRNAGIRELSGAGIAYKMVQALAAHDRTGLGADYVESLADLAAVGTVADVVPLLGENRYILRQGIGIMRAGRRRGLRALLEVSGTADREIKSSLLAFTIVPRINAAGRMDDATDMVEFLLTHDGEFASSYAGQLDTLNSERQRMEARIYEEALSSLDEKDRQDAIVLWGEGWHPGVIGIVAARIAEQYYRPVFIFSVEGKIAKGSARSIPPFDVCGALAGCGSRVPLVAFGGHRQAAGASIAKEHLPAFREEIARTFRETVTGDDLIPSLEIDVPVNLQDVDHRLVKEFEALEPFGYGNAEPLLGAKGLGVETPRIVGNNHLKMRLRQNGISIDAIGFNQGNVLGKLNGRGKVDAVFVPSINEWNGNRYLQLVVKALRSSEG